MPREGQRRPVIGEGDWKKRGNCRGMETNLFFLDRGKSTEDAKAVCSDCPVRSECLEYAMVNGEKFGVWGGLSERERRRLRRVRRLSA